MKMPPKFPKYGNFEIVYCTLISEWYSVKNRHTITLDLTYLINTVPKIFLKGIKIFHKINKLLSNKTPAQRLTRWSMESLPLSWPAPSSEVEDLTSCRFAFSPSTFCALRRTGTVPVRSGRTLPQCYFCYVAVCRHQRRAGHCPLKWTVAGLDPWVHLGA